MSQNTEFAYLSIKDRHRIKIMAEHYIIAALWADAPEGTRPRVTRQAKEKALTDCLAFCQACGPDVLRDVQRRHADGYGAHPDCGQAFPEFAAMGHDLWLTRNGHGAGFWDRKELEEGDLGDKLTAIAKGMKEVRFEFYRGWFYLY